MGFWYWFRAATMVCSLIGVIWVMRYLNGGKTEVHTINGPMSLCATRIVWVEAGDFHLEEHNLHWMRTVSQSGMTELDPTEAERWFTRLCSAKIELVSGRGDYEPALKLGYVNHETAEISRSKADPVQFQMNGQGFKSEGLAEALRTLTKLPEATKPGHQ